MAESLVCGPWMQLGLMLHKLAWTREYRDSIRIVRFIVADVDQSEDCLDSALPRPLKEPNYPQADQAGPSTNLGACGRREQNRRS